MKKFSMLFLAAAVALVGAIVAPNKAEAIPAFARQVGVACYSCHYQHIPKLNSFGREFKLGGFTQSAQDLITDEGLSLPPAFGAAVVVKLRFIQKSPEAVGTKYGEWNLPDEAAILPGGRVAENFGTLLEFNGHGDLVNNKLVFSKDFGGVRGGIVAFATDANSVGYGMELYNTGMQRNQFGTENKDWSAQAIGGAWNTAAQGLGFFAGSDLFFANVSLYGPKASDYAGGGNYDIGFNLSNYIRVALTPKVGDMDLMVGAAISTGKTKAFAGGADVEFKTESTAIDAQLQMPLAGMSLEVVAVYATSKADSTWNGTTNDPKQLSIGATLGLSTHAGVKVGFGSTDTGAASGSARSELFLGGWYAIAQNVDLSLDYVTQSGDAKQYDSKMTLMVEYAF